MQGYSQAAENNKAPIADVMGKYLPPDASVLEIGSGAGQHALHAFTSAIVPCVSPKLKMASRPAAAPLSGKFSAQRTNGRP